MQLIKPTIMPRSEVFVWQTNLTFLWSPSRGALGLHSTARCFVRSLARLAVKRGASQGEHQAEIPIPHLPRDR